MKIITSFHNKVDLIVPVRRRQKYILNALRIYNTALDVAGGDNDNIVPLQSEQ